MLYNILAGKAHEKRPTGRPSCRQLYGINFWGN
jgi:hypothetical protein